MKPIKGKFQWHEDKRNTTHSKPLMPPKHGLECDTICKGGSIKMLKRLPHFWLKLNSIFIFLDNLGL